MKLSIIIPVFNEAKTIKTVLSNVCDVDFDKEIIIVDDGSTDGTKEILKEFDKKFKILNHEKNRGKGAAIKSALKHVTGDIVIFQDADLEYDPDEYKSLIGPILKGNADVVYGSRLSGGRAQRVYMFWHKVGNSLLTLITNILYNTTLTDMETGYKVFKAEIIKDIPINSNGFAVEPEITAKIFKRKLRVYEIPIAYYGRNYEEGKKITWRHGFSAIFTLFWYRIFD